MPDSRTNQLPTYAAILLAAGTGSRSGQPIPKQFVQYRGKPLFRHALDLFLEQDWLEHIVLVVGDGQIDHVSVLLPEASEKLSIIRGGNTRQKSVGNAVDWLRSERKVDRVLVHDAARPEIPTEVLRDLCNALDKYVGATPALPVADTLSGRSNGLLGAVVDREKLVRVQTPQVFHFDELYQAHENWSGPLATDDAQMVRQLGHEIAIVAGSEKMAKLTYSADFEDRAFEDRAGVRQWRPCVGMGFDMHRLKSGEELWLAGLRIEHDQGLAGHSDADVALHALTDAILGAIGDGDIGDHFPPSDVKWQGVSSDRFLAHAVKLADAKGAVLDHLDLTIICERPKIGPYKAAMKQRIADIAAIDSAQVSVKATTTEGLGTTGRGEGIAAQAIASLRLPE